MTNEMAKEVFKFVTATLPDLLSKTDDPLEALQALGDEWKKRRTANIEDRSEQVEKDRAEVDDKLAKRRAASKKGARSRKRMADAAEAKEENKEE
jgi:hypothetical protein